MGMRLGRSINNAVSSAVGSMAPAAQTLANNVMNDPTNPEARTRQIQQAREGGMKRGMEFLQQQGLGTYDEATGKFTPNQFLGSLTPAMERAQMAAREAGLTNIGQQQQTAARQLRGLQAQTGVTGPAAAAQQMALINQGQQNRLGMERELQQQQIDIERENQQRRAQERLLGINAPLQFGGLGVQDVMGGSQLAMGQQGLDIAQMYLRGLIGGGQPSWRGGGDPVMLNRMPQSSMPQLGQIPAGTIPPPGTPGPSVPITMANNNQNAPTLGQVPLGVPYY